LVQARDPNNNITLTQANFSATTIPAAITVYLGQQDGTYRPTTYQLPGVFDIFLYDYPVVIGDINGDGIPDLALKFEHENKDEYAASIAILQGRGDGSFALLPNSPHAVTVNEPITLAKFLGGPATDMMVYSLVPPSIDIIPAASAPPLSISFPSS